MKKFLFLPLLFTLFFSGCQVPHVTSIRDNQPSPVIQEQTNFVAIENGQFVPKSVSIAKGTTLNFENKDDAIFTLASGPHPAHSLLKDLYKIIGKGEIYNYHFDEAGTFGVHLEENPSVNLEIVVK